MGKVTCDRCRREADATQLPTHQYVKFDREVRYLHGRADDPSTCWGRFRQIVTAVRKNYTDEDIREMRIPTHQHVKDGIDGQVVYMPEEEWAEFRQWYFSGQRQDRGNGQNGVL